MAWKLPEGWPTDDTVDLPEEQEVETSEEEGQEPEEASEVEAEEQTEEEEVEGLVETSEEEEEGAQTETPQPKTQTPTEPLVVLKVYGQEIPIYDKDTLIGYAQRGVDYESKMYKLRQWKEQIALIEAKPALKALVEKGVSGENVDDYISFARIAPQQIEQTEIQEDPDDPMTQLRTIVREEITKTVRPALEEVSQIKQKSAKEAFFDQLKKEDPLYFDVVTKLCQAAYNLPEGHPDALPKSLKAAINSDPQAYKTYYGIMRDKVIAYMAANNMSLETPNPQVGAPTKPAPTTQMKLVKQVKKPPIIESGKESGQVTARKVLNEAEEIWNMPSAAFRKLVSDSEKGYKR